MGETLYNGNNSIKPFARITERAGKPVDVFDGCISPDGNVVGTYIHGIFDNDEFRTALIQYLKSKKGLKPLHTHRADFKSIKEQKYNELADVVRRNMNMIMVYDLLR